MTAESSEVMPPPKSAILLTAEDYEEAFYSAKNEVFGRHGYEDAPAGVVAMFESTKVHVRRMSEAGKSLQQSASAGSESAKFFLNEHLKAQAKTAEDLQNLQKNINGVETFGS